MSQESMSWLQSMIRYGFEQFRGLPWWSNKQIENVIFPGAIPEESIVGLLEQAHAVERKVLVEDSSGTLFEVPDRKAIVLPKFKDFVAGIMGDGFTPHQYVDTLWGKIKHLTNGETGCAAAGLLQNGAKAWLQIERPQSYSAAGYEFRPGLLAATSLNGTLATLFKDTVVGAICDNTLSNAIFGGGESIRIKHTRNSLVRLSNSGEAIAALNAMAERMGYAIERAADRKVTDAQFQAFLNKLVPLPEVKTEESRRALTIAENKRESLVQMYFNDDRCKPWNGTALGVLQAVNTYNNHGASFRGAEHRVERITENVISGKLDVMDQLAMEALNKVLVAA